MHRVLLAHVLCFDISVIFDKKIDKFGIFIHDSVVQRTIASLRFLIVDIHRHISSKVLINEPRSCVIITSLRCLHELPAFLQIGVPPRVPDVSVLSP